MRTILITIGGVLAACVAAAVLSPRAPTLAAPAPTPVAPIRPYGIGTPDSVSPRFLASASCASTTCHGNGAIGQLGGEHSTWGSNGDLFDPHRKTYAVLFNDASRTMIRNRFGADAPPAYKTDLCLKCHAVDHEKQFDGEPTADHVLAEGVSCDACHGASERWLTAHYQPGWKDLPNRVKWREHGFKPLKNLVARISACAECHVGTANRDVNHDLIAAGHPRLNFEYTRFHFAPHYQRHWQDSPSFELRAWYVGQVVNLRAAIGLLQARAAASVRSPDATPWPEFSEASCFACHQTIGLETIRHENLTALRASGLPPWQSWSTATFAILPQVHALLVNSPPPVVTDITKLQDEMNRPRPNAANVERLAAAAGRDLDRCLAALQDAEDQGRFRPITPNTLTAFARIVTRNTLTADEKSLRDYDWDFVAQHYLGLAAAFHAAGGSSPSSPVSGWSPALDGLKRTLQFPRTKSESKVNSPLDYRPAEALTHLRAIHDQIAEPGSSR